MVIPSAHATPPCMIPQADWFAEHVIMKSDTVVLARVVGYSEATDYGDLNKLWTKVKVIETVYGTTEVGSELAIRQWQANFKPLYGYEVGTVLLLWLFSEGDDYVIANMDWEHCVPGIWQAGEDGRVMDMVSRTRLTVNGIRRLIASSKRPDSTL